MQDACPFKWAVLNNSKFMEVFLEMSMQSLPCKVRFGPAKVNMAHHGQYLQWWNVPFAYLAFVIFH